MDFMIINITYKATTLLFSISHATHSYDHLDRRL